MPIKCQVPDCDDDAACSVQWRTASMPASAFWYICAAHVRDVVKGLRDAVKDTRWLDARPVLTLKEALLGGPGLDGYAYQADTYCVTCGRQLIEKVYAQHPAGIEYPFAEDSETAPQPIFFGESDTAEHCGECGEYLYGEDEDQ